MSPSRWLLWVVRAIGLVIVACCGLAVAALFTLTDRSDSARAAGAGSVSCSLYASPSGSDTRGTGSQASPFLTAQHLVNELTAGQTGCLMSGTYSQSPGLTFEHGGSAGDPITLASAPGQTATLAGGYVYTPTGSNYVTIENVNINGSGTTQQSIQILGSDDSLIGDDITNDGQAASCIIMGVRGYTPYPTDTLIEDNVIHQCGSTAEGNQNQGIYLSQSQDATITDNIIWGTSGFAIQIYPDADGNTVSHNVVDDNGYGVIFGSADDGGPGSNDNTVDDNIVANSIDGHDASESFGGVLGTGNVYDDDCDYNGGPGDSGEDISVNLGFTASGEVYDNPDFVDESEHTVAGYELESDTPCLAVVGYDTAAQILAADAPSTQTTTTTSTTTASTTTASTTTASTTTASTTTASTTTASTTTASTTTALAPPTVSTSTAPASTAVSTVGAAPPAWWTWTPTLQPQTATLMPRYRHRHGRRSSRRRSRRARRRS